MVRNHAERLLPPFCSSPAVAHLAASHLPTLSLSASSLAGVDIGSYEELIATHIATVEGLREYIGAESLAYLSYEGMLSAVEGADKEGAPGHCTGCFNGVYPIKFDT